MFYFLLNVVVTSSVTFTKPLFLPFDLTYSLLLFKVVVMLLEFSGVCIVLLLNVLPSPKIIWELLPDIDLVLAVLDILLALDKSILLSSLILPCVESLILFI